MRIVFMWGLAVLFGAASLVHAQSLESTPSAAKLRYWASGDCINAGKYVGIDYARALERAIHKEPSGLAQLFRFTLTAGFDGAAGEGHSAILLHKIGCDLEPCPRCGGQAITCDCFYEDD